MIWRHTEDELKPMPFYHRWFIYWWLKLLMKGRFNILRDSIRARCSYLWRKYL